MNRFTTAQRKRAREAFPVAAKTRTRPSRSVQRDVPTLTPKRVLKRVVTRSPPHLPIRYRLLTDAEAASPVRNVRRMRAF
jgi:hypothetical protein